MIFKDYYKILGLETNRVTMDELKVAYRNAAKKNHPDLNVGNEIAEEIIKDINEAYRTLSNPAGKKKYDRKWNMYVGRAKKVFDSNESSKEVLKGMFFGNDPVATVSKHNAKAARGENIETEIEVSINDAYFGLEKKISLKDQNGKTKIFTVEIPKGIKQGEKIRLIGQGKQGKNGGNPGDLVIKINIRDNKKYKLKGSDLYQTVEITPSEAALGKKISIKTIDEEETKLYIPRATQSGDKVSIPEKGYIKNSEQRGNLIIDFEIVVPKRLSKEEKAIYEKLEQVTNFNPRRE